jgi:hypothetical protein
VAQLHSRCNLSAARHPLISAWQARTIILPQHDMNFQKSATFGGSDADKDVGIPQVFYMHNCMPTEQGVQSVGFQQVINPVTGAADFDRAITLIDSSGNKFTYVPASGKNYIFDAPVLSWASLNSISGLDDNVLVTTAFVQGHSYIFYEQNGCYEYNSTTKNFDPVVLGGLVAANIVGILGSNGYLLAWDINGTLYWSSAANPLDFVPSLLTGAGSGAITDLKGRVVAVLPTVNGFIIYGTGNAVGGSFTGNIRFPFNLREIPGSGGIRDKEHVSFESNLEKHYALTSAGLQGITKSSSEVLLPETADFLTSRVFEDYDDVAKAWTVTYPANDLKVKLTIIGARYFIISYGLSSLTHALIYDIAQKKWGKVKIPHVDCFQFNAPNLYGEVTYAMLDALGTLYSDLDDTMYSDLSSSVATAERPRRTIGFLQADGTIKILQFDLGKLDHSAVFLLGRFQFARSHVLQLQGFQVTCIDQGSNYAAFVIPSYDGQNFQAPVTPYLHSSIGLNRAYKCRTTGLNQNLLFTGSFNLASVEIDYNPGGQIRG